MEWGQLNKTQARDSARDRISLVKAFTTSSEKLTNSKVSCILFILCLPWLLKLNINMLSNKSVS